MFQEDLPEAFPSFQPSASFGGRIINGVLKRSVTGARVGLHPSKGGKRGRVFLLLLREVVGKKVKEGYPAGLLHDVEFLCACNGLGSALYLELAVDRVDIPFYRAHRDHEPVCNFTIGVARDDQA